MSVNDKIRQEFNNYTDGLNLNTNLSDNVYTFVL
jgi:hypothetical protein